MSTKVDEIIGWLYDIMSSLEWRVSVLDVLQTENQYPHLMHDLSTEAWQRRIVKEQMEDDAKPKTETPT